MTMTSGQLEAAQRREMNRIEISDMSVCYYCSSTGLSETDKFCPNCGFPQRGEQLEMRQFVRKAFEKNQLLEKKRKAVKNARNLLYALSGLNLLIGVVGFAVNTTNVELLIGGLLLAIVYFSLARWSVSQPFAAIISGFIVFVISHVVGGILNPETISQGLLLKIIIISSFVYGFKGVKDASRLDSELKAMNTPKDLSTPV